MSGPSQQQTQSQQSQNQTAPWWVQQPYLQNGFNAASTAFNQAQNAPAPSNFVAQFTPDQLGLYRSMLGYGSNSPIPGQTAATGGALTSAGTGALTGGLYGLSNYSPTSMAGVLSDANAAANDPSVQGRIDAALRDANRAVSEDALPQLGRNAAASGNTNSSTTGIAQGVIARGLADTTADTSANIRGQAYSQGLSAALSRANAGDANRLGALGALTSAGGNAASLGLGANNSAINQQGALYDIANQGATGGYNANQAAIDDALQRYQFGVNSPFTPVNNLWNIIGANNWGQSSTGSGTSTANSTMTPGITSTLLSLLGASGAFAGKNGLNLFANGFGK